MPNEVCRRHLKSNGRMFYRMRMAPEHDVPTLSRPLVSWLRGHMETARGSPEPVCCMGAIVDDGIRGVDGKLCFRDMLLPP